VTKDKRSYAEGIAEEVLTASPHRIAPKESNYLATSPWQIMSMKLENRYKKIVVEELFEHEKVILPALLDTTHNEQQYHYRNKMEYSFWGDEDGIKLALHARGSHAKQIVSGSILAMPEIDTAAHDIISELTANKARAGDLKTVIIRSNQKGETVAALFTKLEKFKNLELNELHLKGLRVYNSNPKSPASIPTRLLYELGDCTLEDNLLGEPFRYDVDSFFQANLPVFEKALDDIKSFCQEGSLIDMYAGVGAIGLSVASQSLTLVEVDKASVAMARYNAATHSDHLKAEIIEASSEGTQQLINADSPIIFDPPRQGLHPSIVDRLLEVVPPQIIYLSCNPSTHARDLSKLQQKYTIKDFKIYNFFPRTPHIETLALLAKK
jgi:23S rRNA (uracil1939-C5)-methyltransferase